MNKEVPTAEAKDASDETKIETRAEEVVESEEDKARRREAAAKEKADAVERAEKYSQTGGKYGYKAAAELWGEIDSQYEGFSQKHNAAWKKYGQYMLYTELGNIKQAVGKIEVSQIEEAYQEAIKAFSKSYSFEDKNLSKRLEEEYKTNKEAGHFENWVESAKRRQEELDKKAEK